MKNGTKGGVYTALLLLAGAMRAQVETVTPAGTVPAIANPAVPAQAAASSATDPVLVRVLREWPAGRITTLKQPSDWSAEEGLLLDGVVAEWRATGDGALFGYAKAAVDRAVNDQGVIHVNGAAFPVEAHALDDIEMGRTVLTLYRVLHEERYYKAARFLRDQMQTQPRNQSGGYWHKDRYPNQMWLDGSYMAEPFLENYGKTFNHQQDMDGVAAQLLLMDAKMRERPAALPKQGWDEGRQMAWASKKSGLSAELWSRGIGWYAMAVVDVLDRMPASDPQRAALEEVARRILPAIARYQDAETGLWWQVIDKGGQKGNFLEASASCMFVYAIAKGVRLGVAPIALESNVKKGWEGVQERFVKADGTLSGTAGDMGLSAGSAAGVSDQQGGSYEAYVGAEVTDNDAKGVGAYLLALSEMTQRKRAGELLRKARGKTALLDAWFNSQTRATADGNMESFHYKWTDDTDSGYSMWARMFQQYGVRIDALDHAPRAEDLKGVAIYVIASPDMDAVNPKPHFMDRESAEAIEAWTKAGGVLVLMENDPAHADQSHLNMLSDSFGLHFNAVTRNRELDNSYENTLVVIPAGAGGIFHQAHRALMKETCTIAVTAPARTVVNKVDPFMAVAHVGKGVVYANVDPWIYNEYMDGRSTPLGEDNFAAAQELTKWLVGEAVGR